jgi:hypothetical protein
MAQYTINMEKPATRFRQSSSKNLARADYCGPEQKVRPYKGMCERQEAYLKGVTLVENLI